MNTNKHNHFANRTDSGLVYDCNQLQDWLLHTPTGRDILSKERLFLHNNVATIYGQHSLQIGLNKINLLHGNKIPNHYTLNIDFKADLRFLPLTSNSIDLIVCPHVLEFTNNYHHVLQEFYRILAPQGKLFIMAFNRYSWFGLFRSRISLLNNASLISLDKLKNQMQTLSFNLEGGKFFNYLPPFNDVSKIRKYQWLNKIGDRWLPTLANSFAIIATKEIITPTLNKERDLKQYLTKPVGTTLGTAKICHKS